MKSRMKRLGLRIYIIIFLAVLVIPLARANRQQGVISYFDNRPLNDFPQISDDAFEDKLETALQDRIGFREQLVTGYQVINDKAAGELVHPFYTYGKDGYVFFKMHYNIAYSDYHRIFAEAVSKMQKYCEERGARFYFMFDPEKISVYRRYLPDGVDYNDAWVDEMLDYMRELGVKCVSNKDLLMELSLTEQVYNQKYDAGHWNDLGCFYATNNLWRAIQDDYPNVTEYGKEDFIIKSTVQQYLPSSRFPVNEETPVFNLLGGWEDRTDDYKGIEVDSNYAYFKYYINRSEKSADYPRILFFHGSYYNRGPQFLVGRSGEYIGVHDYQNVLNLDYYFNIFQPEIVVFEAAEYTFTDTYFDGSRMAALDYNPSIIGEYGSVGDAVETIRKESEEFKLESNSRLFKLSGDGYDTIKLQRNLDFARYAYLLTDDHVFDLKKDGFGMLSAGVPHGSVTDGATIYYTDYEGNGFFSYVETENAQDYTDGEHLVCSENAAIDKWNKKITFTTPLPENSFSEVDIQLLDGMSGAFIRGIVSSPATGMFTGSYVHEDESGWYRIRLKANSNLKDETVDSFAYLIRGKRYYYAFQVDRLESKTVEIMKYAFFGSSPYVNNGRTYLKDVESTSGVLKRGYERYIMRTNADGNAFGSVILTLCNVETGEYIDPLSAENTTGIHSGLYYHTAEDGRYYLRLRANSNLQDEYIREEVALEKDRPYEWSYEIEDFQSRQVVVSKPSFDAVGEAYRSKSDYLHG